MYIVKATRRHNGQVFFVETLPEKPGDYSYTDKSEKALRMSEQTAKRAVKYLKDCNYADAQIIAV